MRKEAVRAVMWMVMRVIEVTESEVKSFEIKQKVL